MRVDIHGLSEEEEAKTLRVLRQEAPDWGKSKNLHEYLATWPLDVSLDPDIFFATPHPVARQTMLSYLEELRKREDVDWRFVGEGIALDLKTYRNNAPTIKIYDVTHLTGKPDRRLGSKDGRDLPESLPLMSLIIAMIDPDDWLCQGGDNSIHSFSDGQHCFIVISAWPRTHLAVQKFLLSIEKMGGSTTTKLANSRSSKTRNRNQPYASKGSSLSKIHR